MLSTGSWHPDGWGGEGSCVESKTEKLLSFESVVLTGVEHQTRSLCPPQLNPLVFTRLDTSLLFI